MILLPGDRRCLRDIAGTGTTSSPWLARDLTVKGLVLPACHDQPPHVCTATTCPGHMRWSLTGRGVEVVRDMTRLDGIGDWEQIPLFD